MCDLFVDIFTPGHRTVNDSQKTDPKCRFILVELLVWDSSINRAKKDLIRHESHCPCLLRRLKGGALDHVGKIKVNFSHRKRGILLRTMETDMIQR